MTAIVAVDLESNTIFVEGRPHRVAAKTAECFEALLRANGRVASWDYLKAAIWGPHGEVPDYADQIVRMHMCFIRRVVNGVVLIENVRHRGYRIGLPLTEKGVIGVH